MERNSFQFSSHRTAFLYARANADFAPPGVERP
jgi:hypothetical protein